MKLTRLLIQRLPNVQHIWKVFAVIVTIVYSWTLFTSFYKLPSWMFYLTISQIMSIYAYSFSVNLAESILALMGVMFLEFTLFFALKDQEEFQSRSVIVILVVLISSMLRLALYKTYEDVGAFLSGELLWWVVTLALGLLIAVFAPKIIWVRKILDGIAERATVFLYIYLPLSLISLIVVIARNIL